MITYCHPSNKIKSHSVLYFLMGHHWTIYSSIPCSKVHFILSAEFHFVIVKCGYRIDKSITLLNLHLKTWPGQYIFWQISVEYKNKLYRIKAINSGPIIHRTHAICRSNRFEVFYLAFYNNSIVDNSTVNRSLLSWLRYNKTNLPARSFENCWSAWILKPFISSLLKMDRVK